MDWVFMDGKGETCVCISTFYMLAQLHVYMGLVVKELESENDNLFFSFFGQDFFL